MKHWKYFKYLMRHKWFVYVAGRAYGVSFWRLIIHDWSKFLPCEWFPYASYFYGTKPSTKSLDNWREQKAWEDAFNAAWLHHQHFNPHHWQHWVLREDSGATKLMEMPNHFVREMLADWAGARRAITGKWESGLWYVKNRDKIQLAADTRKFVDTVLLIQSHGNTK